MNYYNENNAFCAQWLRNLISAGHISKGVVDERSIVDITPRDLHGFNQCHFFAGIGLWSHALRLAGWPDDQPIWTGSCPCQPFSNAGRCGAFDDVRHLWPVWSGLIDACKPLVIVGEQVASPLGLAWIDLIFNDLENANYATRARDLCAASVGAPHVRQRLYWLAVAMRSGLSNSKHVSVQRTKQQQEGGTVTECSEAFIARLANADRNRWQQGEQAAARSRYWNPLEPNGCDNHWGNADWLLCRDGKYRPVESGTFPLAHGDPARVGKLRAYGNAIVPQVAAKFIKTELMKWQ